MKKIFFFVCLISVLALTCFFEAYAGEIEESYGSYDEFLDMLSISAEITDPQSVTRAEFAALLTRAMNYTDYHYREGVFADVTSETEYASSIIKAYEIGMISGSGNGNFSPEAPITANAALKMAVCALGFSEIAQSYGGYPTGYHRLASEIGFLDNMSIFGDSPLNIYESKMLIFNFLMSSIYSPDTMSEGWITYNKNTGETPLSVYFNLKCIEGVAETAGYATMLDSAECDHGSFCINGKSFKTNIQGAEKYLGMNITAWYDKDSSEVKAVFDGGNNTVHTIYADESVRFESGAVRAYDEKTGKEKSYRVSSPLKFVRNGRPVSYTDSDFKFGEGYMKLIDNNGDGRADVVCAMVCEYVIIKNVDADNGIIYTDSKQNPCVSTECTEGYYCSITSADGQKIAVSALKPDGIMSLYRSDNGKYCEIIVSYNTVSGTLNEVGDDYLIVDSNKYEYNSHFDRVNSINAGGTYVFLLAHNNTITALSSDTRDSFVYGYVLDYVRDVSDMERRSMLSVLTDTGEYMHYSLAKNILLDGVSVQGDSDVVRDVFIDGNGNFKYQVIRYCVGSDFAVTKIDTALTVASDALPESALLTDKYGDNTLSKFLSYHNTYWYNGGGAFAPNVLVGSDTVIFSVPLTLGTNPTTKFEKEDFSVITTGVLSSWGAYRIDAYDAGEHLTPKIIVVYNPNAGTSVQVAETASLCLVESVRDTETEDGDTTKSIVYYSDGVYNKRIIAPDKYKYIEQTAQSLKSGDLVRVALNGSGDIVGLKIDASYNNELKKAVFVPNYIQNRRYDTAYYSGKSFSHSDKALTLLVDPSTAVNADPTYAVTNGVAAFSFDPSLTVAVYNSKRKTVSHANADYIADVMSVGEANATSILIKCNFHKIQQIFIYE